MRITVTQFLLRGSGKNKNVSQKRSHQNAKPIFTNRRFTVRLNGTLREVYTTAIPNVTNRRFMLRLNESLRDVNQN